MPVRPMRRDPAGVRARRQFPAPRNPYVRASVPAMVTGDPHITVARRNTSRFHHRARRRHSHHNFLAECAEGQKPRKNKSDQSCL